MYYNITLKNNNIKTIKILDGAIEETLNRDFASLFARIGLKPLLLGMK